MNHGARGAKSHPSDGGTGVWAWLVRNGPQHPRLILAISVCVLLVLLVGVEALAWMAINDRAARTGSTNTTGPFVGLVLLQAVGLAIAIPYTAKRFWPTKSQWRQARGRGPRERDDSATAAMDRSTNHAASPDRESIEAAHVALIRSVGIEVLVLLAVFVLGFVVSAWLRQAGVARWLADGFLLLCLAVVGLRLYLRRGLVDQLVESTARVHEARSRNPR